MSGATTSRLAYPDLPAEARRIIGELKRTVAAGETHWFLALMQAVREWPLPQEKIGERTYRYLVGGEAFDWLLLAERLCDEIEDLIPDDEREALLVLRPFAGRSRRERRRAPARRQASRAPQLRLRRARGRGAAAGCRRTRCTRNASPPASGRRTGSLTTKPFSVCTTRRVPSCSQSTSQALTTSPKTRSKNVSKCRPGLRAPARSAEKGRAEHNGHDSDPGATEHDISLADLTEFTYWLFRRRVSGSEPARVASDTRKGVAALQRLEAQRRGRGVPATSLL